MGLDRSIFYGAFAMCEKKLVEGDENKGKKCPNEHVFLHHGTDKEFCAKCGERLVPWTEFTSRYESPAMELTDKMHDKFDAR